MTCAKSSVSSTSSSFGISISPIAASIIRRKLDVKNRTQVVGGSG
jgi:DNA-binding CsgD family transcriptional regulator